MEPHYLTLRASILQAAELGGPSDQIQQPGDAPGPRPRQWHSGNPQIDAATDGGMYGLTVLGGKPKLGKSKLALSAAVEASRWGQREDHWRVIYVNAELPQYEISNRCMAYCCGPPGEFVTRNLMFLNVLRATEPRELAARLATFVGPTDLRVLVVFDSINRLVAMSGRDYFTALHEWSEFCRMLPLLNQEIAVLAVSEMNQKGGLKGENLSYAASLVVTMDRVEGESDVVRIAIPYARSSRAYTPLGDFYRNYNAGTFDAPDEPKEEH